MPRFIWTSCCLLCLILASNRLVAEEPAAPGAGAALLPVPAEAARATAQRVIREIYGSDFSDTTPAGKRKLAKKLLNESSSLQSDPNGRYAILCDARDAAISTGDSQTAFAAIGALAQIFAIDANLMGVEAIIAMNAKGDVEDNTATVEAGLHLLNVLLQKEQFAAASKLAPSLRNAAVKTHKAPLTAAVKAASANMELAIIEAEKIKAPLEKLKTDPADPAANTALGKYLCFHKGDWQGGLAALQKGGDLALRNLARGELANPAQPLACKALADSWWDLGNASAEPLKGIMHARAAMWYQHGLDLGFAGLEKVLAERRIADAGPASRTMWAPFGVVTAAPAAPVVATTPDPAPAPSQPPAPATPEAGANVPIPKLADWSAMRQNPARIDAVQHYTPRNLVQANDFKQGWETVPPVFQKFPAVIYDQKIKGDTGVVEFVVSRSGNLFLAINYNNQGNRSGGWTDTRLKQEDFIQQGWQLVENASLGGVLKYSPSKTDHREQIILVKQVKKGEKYSLRCNKYDPPFVILFK